MRTVALVCGLVAALTLTACGGGNSSSGPDFDKGATPYGLEPTPTETPPLGSSAPSLPQAPTALAPGAPGFVPPTAVQPQIFAGGQPPGQPNAPPQATQTPGPTPTLAPGLKTVPAPIDGLDVRRQGSSPVPYVLNVRAGLPSGCARQYTNNVVRSGDSFKVTVLNTLPTGDIFCTDIYASYELNLALPGSFVSGRTYNVQVNDKSTSFKAQ